MALELLQHQTGRPATCLALGIAVGVLLIDVFTPAEMAPQMLYVMSVLVAAWSQRERTIWVVALTCSILTVLGVILSPPGFDFSIILFNRITGIVLIWLTAGLAWQYRRTQDRLCLVNKELETRVEQRTQELSRAFDEREQLNRNLHDDILQSLYAVGLQLEASQPPSQQEPAGAVAIIDQALRQLKLAMQQIRTYIAGPQPINEETQPFDMALAALVQTMTLAHGPRLRLTIEPGLSNNVSREHAESTLLIVREALSNCVRHSRAQQGLVAATNQNGGLRIEIEDDGVGFDQEEARKNGHGVANMVARAKAIGAEFSILSRPGHGVRIALHVLPRPRSVRS